MLYGFGEVRRCVEAVVVEGRCEGPVSFWDDRSGEYSLANVAVEFDATVRLLRVLADAR